MKVEAGGALVLTTIVLAMLYFLPGDDFIYFAVGITIGLFVAFWVWRAYVAGGDE